MIPADHWHDNGDGTAWLVVAEFHEGTYLWGCDRPCDTCDGDGEFFNDLNGSMQDCPYCYCTGRHTFRLLIHDTNRPSVLVSVVPDMVLPIVDLDNDWHPDPPFIGVDIFWVCEIKREPWPKRGERITLPPAAAPGMWAVKLEVHS